MTARRLASQLSLWGPVVACMALIFALSSRSDLPAPPAALDDKRTHALAYGTLAALSARAFAGGRWRGLTARRALMAALLATAYGLTDEAHQRFVPGRTAEWLDVAADAIGSTVAAVVLWACGIIHTRFRPQQPDVSP